MGVPQVNLQLPYPPTANTYYRKWNNRMVISARGREYAREVAAIVGKMKPLRCRIAVIVVVAVPDRRKRDIDNLTKPLFDSLTKAGVWVDDSQVDFYSMERVGITPGGACSVVITEYIDKGGNA